MAVPGATYWPRLTSRMPSTPLNGAVMRSFFSVAWSLSTAAAVTP